MAKTLLVSSRDTFPDIIPLVAQIKVLTTDSNAIIYFVNIADYKHYIIDTITIITPSLLTTIQNALDTASEYTSQRQAQDKIDSWSIEIKALVLTLIDEINILRNLAGLQSRTPAQAIAAIRNKAGTL